MLPLLEIWAQVIAKDHREPLLREGDAAPALGWAGGRAHLPPGASSFTSPHCLSWRRVSWILSWAPPLGPAHPAWVSELSCEIPNKEEANLLWISLDLHGEHTINSTITHYQLHSLRNPKPDEIIFLQEKLLGIFVEHFSWLLCPVLFNSCHCSCVQELAFYLSDSKMRLKI